MIRLLVEDYCHNCPEFEPNVTKDSFRLAEEHTTTVITCIHQQRCENIKKYIEKEGNCK